MKRTFKVVGLVLMVYVGLSIITPHNEYLRNRSIENQINYLSEILSSGYDNTLQARYPEGKIFSNALLALSIIEYCDNKNTHTQAFAEKVDSCIIRMLSHEAQSNFQASTTPPLGMFYNGWTGLTLKTYKKSRLFEFSSIAQKVNQEFTVIRQRITNAQKERITPLESYPGSYWPADNLIGICSIEDPVLQSRWISLLDSLAIHPSGLIHHKGSLPHIVRGSSSAMINYCLTQLDSVKATQYNVIFNKVFVQNILGANLVYENEDHSNVGDVDSGPLLFGFGASATIMNIKTQASLNASGARATWGWMNCIAIPVNLFGAKFYLFKQEPMLDLFLLWSAVEL